MMKEYYKALGLTEEASIEEIEKAYSTLKEKYSRERFYEGEVGNEAARKLTLIENAYQEIMAACKTIKENGNEKTQDFSEVENCIRNGDISGAQQKLDDYSDRTAEWHYLQSVVFYKKNWMSESKKQLEIAVNMEPSNTKYSDALTKLKQKMEYNDRQYQSGYAQGPQGAPQYENRQMGGADSCLNFCAAWCCMDMLCSICCR